MENVRNIKKSMKTEEEVETRSSIRKTRKQSC